MVNDEVILKKTGKLKEYVGELRQAKEITWEKYQKDIDNLLIVDTRQEWEFRTGHIKKAVNFPIEPTWLSRWQKKKSLETFLGPDKNKTIVFY